MSAPGSTASSPRTGVGGSLRGLVDEAWDRAWKRRRRLLAVVIAAGLVFAAMSLIGRHNRAPRGPAGAVAVSHLPIALHLSPVLAGKHERIVVSITARRPTGVADTVMRSYFAATQAVRPRVDCVNNRGNEFPYSGAGTRITAVLDPAAGDGGPQGWCPGVYRGVISYSRAFDCGLIQGPCTPAFPTATEVVARFTYRVR